MLGDHRIEPVQALGDACHDLHGERCDIVELLGVLAHPATLLREFDDIGQVVHEFASEDATVVIGTALDPELKDDVRVTVVATGLNRAVARQPILRETRETARPPMRVIKRDGTTGQVVEDYLGIPGQAVRAAIESGRRARTAGRRARHAAELALPVYSAHEAASESHGYRTAV